jgi:hypothetical protein
MTMQSNFFIYALFFGAVKKEIYCFCDVIILIQHKICISLATEAINALQQIELISILYKTLVAKTVF